MNIFIDTSVIHQDPLWEGNYLKQLVETKCNIYISDVVLMEAKYNYAKKMDEIEQAQKKAADEMKSFGMVVSTPLNIDRTASLTKLDGHFRKLKEYGFVKILPYSNDMLPEILARAVERRKPFSKGKTELKDALIWLTYAKYAEKNALADCILLSGNISDFSDSGKLEGVLTKFILI